MFRRFDQNYLILAVLANPSLFQKILQSISEKLRQKFTVVDSES